MQMISIVGENIAEPLPLDVEYAAAEVSAINAGNYIRFDQEIPILRLYKFYYSSLWYWIVWLADVALLLLPCFERPAFFTEVPQWVALLIEIVALAILTTTFLISVRFQDRKRLFHEAIHPYMFIVILILTILDMIIYYFLTLNGIYYVRWTRPLRVLFPFALQTGQKVRRIVRNIFRTLPTIANVMFLFVLSSLIFTLLGVGILKNRNLTYSNGDPYFKSYIDTIWDLYVLTTTANNPDVMMPAFNESMLYVIFFVAYLLVNLYLFMSLLLAVIFSNYKQQLQDEQKLIEDRQYDALMSVFKRLASGTSPQRVTYETYQRLMRAINSKMSENTIEAYWHTLDIDNHEDGLDIKQFNELLFNLNFELRECRDDDTFIDKTCPSCYNSRPSRLIVDFVNTAIFRAVVSILIVGNAICLAVGYNGLEWFFLAIFVIEALLKMYAFGFIEYFHHRWNIFDFTIIFVSTTYSLLTQFVKSLELNRDILDAILVVRVMRLIKLVRNVHRFEVIFETFSKVIPTLITYLRVMFMTYYIFAMIGMELFQYKIAFVESNATLASVCNNSRLEGSEFARGQYCRNNFNDYLSSLILLFELTVVNQWHVLASGFVLVTSKWARLYFIIFHLCAVIVVLNIFTAFIIDSFLTQYLSSQKKEFPWSRQEEMVTKRLIAKRYRIFRRYNNPEESDREENGGFNLSVTIRNIFRPSAYRRTTISIHNMDSDEHVFLLRWSGNSNIDPESLLHLIKDTL